MKTVFVNRFFFPDHSATSQLLTELVIELGATGRSIHVVTSRQLYEDALAALPQDEDVSKVHIHRVRTTSFGRKILAGRALDYFTFYFSALFLLLRLLKRGDIVVAMTDPPLVSLVAATAAKFKGAKLVNWLQDVFPEVAERLGVKFIKGIPGAIARRLRNQSLQQARANVVLGERMAEFVNFFAPNPKIIHNWAVGDANRPIEPHQSDLRREWGLSDRFVVGYSGNMGRAHEFETILDAIEAFRDDENVLFLFIGGGQQLGQLRAEVEQRSLAHVVMFQPYQPKERLAHSLGAANVHLVTLQPSLEGLVVPSKVYGIAAIGRPMLFVGDTDGEIPRILRQFDCGFGVATGDSASLVKYIGVLRADPKRSQELGANARRMLERQFERRLAVDAWVTLLNKVEEES